MSQASDYIRKPLKISRNKHSSLSCYSVTDEKCLTVLHTIGRLLGPYSQHFIFSQLMNRPNKLERYITLTRKACQ